MAALRTLIADHLVVLMLAVSVGVGWLWRTVMHLDRILQRRRGRWIIGIWAGLVVVVTQLSGGQARGVPRAAANLVPLAPLFDHTSPPRLSEILANVVLFVPLGLFGPLLLTRAASTTARSARLLAAGLLMSVAMESLQYLLNTGRAADVDDVLTNVLGTLAGLALFAAANRFSPAAVTERGTEAAQLRLASGPRSGLG